VVEAARQSEPRREAMTRENLLVYAAGQESAIDDEDMAGDKAGGIGGEKDRGSGEFLNFAEALHGSADEELLAAAGGIEKVGVQVGAENSGSNGIDADAVLGPFDRERFGEGSEPRLAGGVGGDFVQSNEGRKRSDVDDAAVAALNHVAAHHAAGAKDAVQIGFQNVIPFFVGDFEGRSALGFPGGIHEDLHGAEFLASSIEKMLHGGLNGDIAGNFERAASDGADFAGSGADHVGAAAGGNHVGSGDGEAFGDFPSDAAGAAEYKGRLAGEVELRVTQENSPSACE